MQGGDHAIFAIDSVSGGQDGAEGLAAQHIGARAVRQAVGGVGLATGKFAHFLQRAKSLHMLLQPGFESLAGRCVIRLLARAFTVCHGLRNPLPM